MNHVVKKESYRTRSKQREKEREGRGDILAPTAIPDLREEKVVSQKIHFFLSAL